MIFAHQWMIVRFRFCFVLIDNANSFCRKCAWKIIYIIHILLLLQDSATLWVSRRGSTRWSCWEQLSSTRRGICLALLDSGRGPWKKGNFFDLWWKKGELLSLRSSWKRGDLEYTYRAACGRKIKLALNTESSKGEKVNWKLRFFFT